MREDSYKEFLDKIKLEIERNTEGKEVTVSEYRKNNGLILCGLQIKQKDKKIVPVIYLESFYDMYLEGAAYDEIAKNILDLYKEHSGGIEFDEKRLLDYSDASKYITYRLINYENNIGLLENIPHRRLLDLVLVYYYVVDVGDKSTAAALVNNDILKSWNVDEEELYRIARENTPRLFPLRVQSIQEALNGLTQFEFAVGDKGLDFMYIFSNTMSTNGAATMVYPKALADFSKAIDEDLYILPSSIHEVIVLPKTVVYEADSLKELVQYVNENEVLPQEVLSHTVYCYDRATGLIGVA